MLNAAFSQVSTRVVSSGTEEKLEDFEPREDAVYSRMTSPVETTFVDIEKIGLLLLLLLFFFLLLISFI